MTRRALPAHVVLAALIVLVGASCTGEGDQTPPSTVTAVPTSDGSSFSAQVASADLAADSPEPVQVGVFSSTEDAGVRLLSFGEVDIAFSFLGTDGSGEPTPGPTTTGRFVPAPGTAARDGDVPTLTNPAEVAGVYMTREVTFDEPGIWSAAVTVSVDGAAPTILDAAFTVYPEHRIPAPTDDAPLTENLTTASKGVPAVAIDSRAQDGAKVPDPQLHDATIAETIRAGRPALVQFATPVYCQSQFCGPTVEAQEALEREYRDVAEFIHVEIWRDYEASTVNRAAAEWLLREDSLSEPWMFLIDADGVIVERWGPLFDLVDVRAALDALRG